MKLFRMAFWLGVVICNLPSPASRPAAPESQLNRSQGLAAQAASQFCPQPLETCARIDAVLSKRGELRGPNFSRDAAKPCQDTLAPADREVALALQCSLLWPGARCACVDGLACY